MISVHNSRSGTLCRRRAVEENRRAVGNGNLTCRSAALPLFFRHLLDFEPRRPLDWKVKGRTRMRKSRCVLFIICVALLQAAPVPCGHGVSRPHLWCVDDVEYHVCVGKHRQRADPAQV